MAQQYQISTKPLKIKQIARIIKGDTPLSLSKSNIEKINACRSFLEQKISNADQLHYGINTGFGVLCDIEIAGKDLSKLQENLVRSHACGTGAEVPLPLIKLMLLLKIKGLSLGHSGVRLKLIERLITFFNHDLLPVIYQQGSLGASGDLAPLAHLSLPLVGEGDVYLRGKKMPARVALKILKLKPLKMSAKEGLALLNGTQFSSAYCLWAVMESKKLMQLANVCAAISIDAFDGLLSPFTAALHHVRPHRGQLVVAKSIQKLLKGSSIANGKKKYVQDPYSFRCVPQVHGASWDALAYAQRTIETEINSVTDNPTLFPEEDLIISGGNFHAQPLALATDFLSIAMAELGSIAERRIFHLISGSRGLPKFLVKNPGLHSGLMIPQYTAASIVSQNKQLCTPASVDSIVSCDGQEDHVSMAANAGTKSYQVVQNVERVLAIEFFTAMQALTFRQPRTSSKKIENLLRKYREKISFVEADRVFSEDIQKTILFLRSQFS